MSRIEEVRAASPDELKWMDDKEAREYLTDLGAKVEALKQGGLDPGKVGALISALKSGVEIPQSMFGRTERDVGLWVMLWGALKENVGNHTMFDLLCWLMARIAYFVEELACDVPISEFQVLESMLCTVGVTHRCFHVLDLWTNVIEKRRERFDGWRHMGVVIPLVVDPVVGRSAVMCIRNGVIYASHVFGLIECLTSVVDSIEAILSHQHEQSMDNARILLFTVADVVISGENFLNSEWIYGRVAVFGRIATQIVDPRVVEPALLVMVRVIQRAECFLDTSGFPSMMEVMGLVKRDDEANVAVQYAAVRLLRLMCDRFPGMTMETGVMDVVCALHEIVPYRIRSHLIYIVGQFLHHLKVREVPDVETKSVQMLRFLMDNSLDSDSARVAIWTLMGMKWSFARYGASEVFARICGVVGTESFINTCCEMDDPEVIEMTENYARLDSYIDRASTWQMDHDLLSRQTDGDVSHIQRIRFCVGSVPHHMDYD